MKKLNFSCQLFTWQMSGEKYVGKLGHILDITKKSNFAAIESEIIMLGNFFDNPDLLTRELKTAGIKLSTVVLTCDWKFNKETKFERLLADKLINFLKNFPGTHMMTGQLAGTDRSDLAARQKNAIACLNAVASRAVAEGMTVSFHPNSLAGSIFRTREDYEVLLNGLDRKIIGFCPDSGHIARGDMDVMEILRQYMPLIKNIHFKDISSSGEWVGMGHGIIDFPGIVKLLRDGGYTEWVVIEEESAKARTNPDQAVIENGKYIMNSLVPLL